MYSVAEATALITSASEYKTQILHKHVSINPRPISIRFVGEMLKLIFDRIIFPQLLWCVWWWLWNMWFMLNISMIIDRLSISLKSKCIPRQLWKFICNNTFSSAIFIAFAIMIAVNVQWSIGIDIGVVGWGLSKLALWSVVTHWTCSAYVSAVGYNNKNHPIFDNQQQLNSDLCYELVCLMVLFFLHFY